MKSALKTKEITHVYDIFINELGTMTPVCKIKCPLKKEHGACPNLLTAKAALGKRKFADAQKSIFMAQECLGEHGRISHELIQMHRNPKVHRYEFFDGTHGYNIVITAPLT